LDATPVTSPESVYAIRANIAANLNKTRGDLAAKAEEGPRRIYLGAGSAVGLLGILGGVLDAINTLEDKELEWIITSAAYAVVILVATGFVLLKVMSFAADKDTVGLTALDAQINDLLDFARHVTAPSANGAGETLPAVPPSNPRNAVEQSTSTDPG
jgi:hypothetical protein